MPSGQLRSKYPTSIVVASSMAIIASACSPYIKTEDIHPYTLRQLQSNQFSDVDIQLAIQYIVTLRNRYYNVRDDRVLIDRASGLGVVGGAAGAAIAGAYGANRDLIIGLISAGALSLAGSQLYGNRGQNPIYNAAAEALTCIQGRTLAAYEPLDRIILAYSLLLSEVTTIGSNILESKAVVDRKPDIRLLSAINTSIMTHDRARALLASAQGKSIAPKALARAAIDAADQVVASADKQLEKLEPRIEEIAAVAASFSPAALTSRIPLPTVSPHPVPGTPPPAPGSPTPAGAPALIDSEVLSHIVILTGATERVKAATKNLEEAVSGEVAIVKPDLGPCALSVLATAPIVVEPTIAVQIRKGDEHTLFISGGNGKYQASWAGKTPPSEELALGGSILVGGNTLSLKAGTKLTTGRAFALRVSDVGGAARAAMVTVQTD